MNFILVIIDSLRKDHVGAYGNTWIKTPNLDQFARESVRFERAYPEAMPTLPFRNSILTGRRGFPFKRWKPHVASWPVMQIQGSGKDWNVPGWAPLDRDDTPMAEYFVDRGYRTALVTDDHARVLRQDGSPIEGLYATGNCSASVMGHSYAGAGATIGPSMVFGYIAALHAVGR